MPLFARIPKNLFKKAEDESKEYKELLDFVFDKMDYETYCEVLKSVPQTRDYLGEPAQAICEVTGEIDLKTVEDKFGKLDMLDELNDVGGVVWDYAHDILKDLLNDNPKEKNVFDLTDITYSFKIEKNKLIFNAEANPKSGHDEYEPEYDPVEELEREKRKFEY